MKWKRKKKKSHQFDLDCACEQCRKTYNGVAMSHDQRRYKPLPAVGTDREIRGLKPSGRTLESRRCCLPCLCHRSVTRGPSRASGADQGLAASALRGRAAAVLGH